MSEMFERVAAAIRESEAYWWNRADEPNDGLAETLARVAIEAMHEPTVEMLANAYPCEKNEEFSHSDKCLGAAVCLKLGGGADIGLLEGEAVKQAAFLARDYRLMIDAALSDMTNNRKSKP